MEELTEDSRSSSVGEPSLSLKVTDLQELVEGFMRLGGGGQGGRKAGAEGAVPEAACWGHGCPPSPISLWRASTVNQDMSVIKKCFVQ